MPTISQKIPKGSVFFLVFKAHRGARMLQDGSQLGRGANELDANWTNIVTVAAMFEYILS
jgi:hypothetical protein